MGCVTREEFAKGKRNPCDNELCARWRCSPPCPCACHTYEADCGCIINAQLVGEDSIYIPCHGYKNIQETKKQKAHSNKDV